MKSYLAAIAVGLGAALAVPSPVLAAPVNVMADSCSGCHGTDGQSLGAMPAFNTKSADELKKMLRDYRSGAREATVMDRIMKGYTEAQLEAIVDYYKK